MWHLLTLLGIIFMLQKKRPAVSNDWSKKSGDRATERGKAARPPTSVRTPDAIAAWGTRTATEAL